MKKAILSTFLGLAAASIASAGPAGTERSGGDNVGLNFQATAAQAITLLKPGALSAQDLASLKNTLDQAKYVVVDDALFISLGGDASDTQNSVAINDKSTETVTISRSRWLALSKPLQRDEIALHELLGLDGVESTGDYHVSSTLQAQLAHGAMLNPTVLYSRFYDDSLEGFDTASAEDQCAFQKSVFENKYDIVYCSYLEKDIPHVISQSGRHHKTVYETAYGLEVLGVGQRDVSGNWVTVFSSKDFLGGEFGTLEYSSADDAMNACAMELAESLKSEPMWIGARCFAQADSSGGKYFYEIRIPQ